MDYVGFWHSSPKSASNGKAPKICQPRNYPERLTFSGNFSRRCKDFDVTFPERRASMRQDILDAVTKRTETVLEKYDDNPMYEDPRDVIGEKPPKPPRKRNLHPSNPVQSPRVKDGKTMMKDQKRKLTKKYEGLITTLMDRCEENVVLISEKENQIIKLKDKLRSVLEYNKLFAEENDQLKGQHTTLAKYIEECKRVVREERERSKELEQRSKELEERVKKFEVPDREHPEPCTAIPLVEVCMSCSSRQIVLQQAREQNSRLQKDMHALKDVLYRLNVQLSRYQEKVRSNIQTIGADGKGDLFRTSDKFDLDSLITASLAARSHGDEAVNAADSLNKGAPEHQATRVVDWSGLLSAQALAPLFDAYQENLQEKDSLILDYEKQFENMNKKSKQIVAENKTLSERVSCLEQELVQMRQSYKKAVVERETADIEKATLVERAERAESKLKEVYELYEDKIAAMMRDYETVHREYFAVRSALEQSEGRAAQADVLRARTVPADLHERRLEHCKRLLEELKHQYSMENERKSEQTKKLEDQLRSVEEKHAKLCQDHEVLKEELTTALKNVRLYRKAAVIFRQRVKAATARATRVRRSRRGRASEPLRQALDTLERIKGEIKVVKSRAHTSLEELERRILEQERRAARAQTEYRRELERAATTIEHKESIIRSLIDKVADVEEVRLSQTNTHRLQGIVSDSDQSLSPADPDSKETKVKLVPTSGGYYQEKEPRRKGKG